jgi:hypothetical protein
MSRDQILDNLQKAEAILDAGASQPTSIDPALVADTRSLHRRVLSGRLSLQVGERTVIKSFARIGDWRKAIVNAERKRLRKTILDLYVMPRSALDDLLTSRSIGARTPDSSQHWTTGRSPSSPSVVSGVAASRLCYGNLTRPRARTVSGPSSCILPGCCAEKSVLGRSSNGVRTRPLPHVSRATSAVVTRTPSLLMRRPCRQNSRPGLTRTRSRQRISMVRPSFCPSQAFGLTTSLQTKSLRRR